MANRYWVGGDGNWNQPELHWSDSSGGTPSASFLPTSVDNVIFDGNSNVGTSAFTVFVDETAAANCQDFSTSSLDGAMTLLMNATSVLNVYGSMTLPATNFTWTSTLGSIVNFLTTSTGKTITTNGVSFGVSAIVFNGVGGYWTLGSAISISSSITLLAGTLDSGSFNISTGSGMVLSTGTATRSFILGSSTFTQTSSQTFPLSGISGLTIDFGTSTIVFSGATATLAGNGNTFYNVTFSGGAGAKTINGANTYNGQFLISNAAATTIAFGANQTFTGGALIQATSPTILGTGISPAITYSGTVEFASAAHGIKTFGAYNTFQNLKITCPTVDGITTVSLAASTISVTGTLTTTDGGSTARRVQIASQTAGTQRTFSVGTNSLVNTDFKDIAASGTASWTFGLGYGDLGNNSGITFNASTLYWIGGTGNWSSTTNWSTSSGGTAANAVPCPQNSVIFDANSNTGTTAFTVTGNAAMQCNDFSTGGAGGALDGAMTFAMGGNTLSVYGNYTLPATNLTITSSSGASTTFKSTSTGKTITSNGVSLTTTNSLVFDGVGGGWTLGSAIIAGGFQLIRGSFNTANYSMTHSGGWTISGAETRSISLGSSTITISASSIISIVTTGLTFDAGTSTIQTGSATTTINGGGATFYNVSFISTAIATVTITGANTYNNLTFAARAAAGMGVLNIADNQTVSGTLTLGSGTTGVARLSVQSSVVGTPRTLTVATLAAPTDVDFRDITAAGASAPWSGTRLGNCLGNTNITFPAAKTVYWNLAAGGNYNTAAWATTSGGTAATTNFPLAQDTAIIENTGLTTGNAITLVACNTGTINMSTRSNAMNLAHSSTNTRIYGNLILSSAVTTTATTGGFVFNAQGVTQQITTAGAALAGIFIIENATGTVQLQDNCTISNSGSSAFGLTSGTLDLNEFNLSIAGRLANSGTLTRSIDFGSSGKIYLTYNGGATFTILNAPIIDNFTIIGTSYIEANGNNTAGSRTFSLGVTSGALTDGSNSPNLYISAGTDTLNITSYVKDLNFTGFSGTFSNGTSTRRIYGNVVLSSTMTFSGGTASFIFDKASGTQTITTNGIVMDCGIAIGTSNSPTLQLLDNLTTGSTRVFTLTNGTLNVNSKVMTVGIFSSSNSNTRVLNLGTNGKIAVNGGNWTITPTNLTLSGTGTISMDYGTAKTFAGGGVVYPYTLNQGGAGNLTITGANTFNNITNTVQPCTITFPAATTTSVKNFDVKGTAGNLVSLRSSTTGTQYTLAYVS